MLNFNLIVHTDHLKLSKYLRIYGHCFVNFGIILHTKQDGVLNKPRLKVIQKLPKIIFEPGTSLN